MTVRVGKRDVMGEVEENNSRYQGEYVATASFSSKKIVAHGKTIVEVYKEAQEKGIKAPVVIYIPLSNACFLY